MHLRRRETVQASYGAGAVPQGIYDNAARAGVDKGGVWAVNFEEPHLLAHYKGSWVRAQVAFYDFLFETSSTMTPEEFRKESMKAVTTGEFSDGTEFYE